MACSDEMVIPEEVPRMALMERRVNKLVIQKGKTGKARKSAATISEILPGKMDMAPVEAGKAVDKIQTEKMRKPLVVVVEALETKNKGSGSREALVETGKEIDKNQTERSVEALVEATGKDAVAVDKNQTERSTIDKIFDDWEWVGDEFFEDTSGEVDEEDLKQVAELQEDLTRIWRDWVNSARLAGIEFADPSDPHCLVAC